MFRLVVDARGIGRFAHERSVRVASAVNPTAACCYDDWADRRTMMM